MTTPKVVPLYEIVDAYESIGEVLMENGGDLTDELQQQWDEITEKFETKVENTALYIRNLDATAKALAVEAARFNQRAKSIAVASKRLKGYLQVNMERADIKTVKTLRVNATVTKNSRPTIRWTKDVSELPIRFRRAIVSLDGDLAYTAWKADLNGLPDGFEVELGQHLRLR